MKRAAQLLLSDDFKMALTHGGDHAKGRRKTMRPFSSRRPMHIVLRSDRAKGQLSLRTSKNLKIISRLIAKYAKTNGIRIYNHSINSNHIHLLIKAPTRPLFQRFLRTLTGQIAQKLTGATRGKPQGAFWAKIAFTRLLTWGRDYLTAKRYVRQNQLEATGEIAYRPRAGEIRQTQKARSGSPGSGFEGRSVGRY